ncbi:MAG: hypothetical protein ACLQU2_26005 [Candidatus Binataceae bacterium]
MAKKFVLVILALITLAPIFNQPSFGGEATTSAAPPAPPNPKIGVATIVTVHGKIAAVDRAKRLVTLTGPQGEEVTIKVEDPYNLAAAKPGEPFVARFRESVTVRRKRPGEVLPAVSIKEGVATALPGETPGGVIKTHRKAVVKVSAIDEKDKTVTVKAPDGSEETVKVSNAKYLKQVKVGDELVVSVKQAVAISLAKE